MQIFVQFYTLFVLVCLVLFKSFRDILTNNLLKAVLGLFLYSGIIRIMAEVNPHGMNEVVLASGCFARALFTPAAFLVLRNQLYHRSLSGDDTMHLLPFTIFGAGCTIAFLVNGNLDFIVASKTGTVALSAGSQLALFCFQVFVYAVTGLYFWLILLLLKDKFGRISPSTGSMAVVATELVDTSEAIPDKLEEDATHRSLVLTEERMKEMDTVIRDYLQESRSFLRHKYSLRDLAQETSLALHHLSAFINQYYRINFNDFINEYRVDFCKEKIRNGECRFKKLEAIAEESGFNNRNTFTAAFKKVTGQNPSEFLKLFKNPKEVPEENEP
jgi:AraC-like DNA-binding protein